MARKLEKGEVEKTVEGNTEMVLTDASLYTHNFPVELPHIPKSMSQPFLSMTFTDYDSLGTLELENEYQAIMVYYSNGPIMALDRTTLDLDTRKWLNKYGLKIYLTEPLCSHMADDRYADKGFI